MFERIVIRDRVQSFPGSPFDVGFLAESMLFYGHTHVVGHTAAFFELVRAFGPDLLIDFLRDTHFTFTYQPNFFGVHTNGDEHTFITATIPRRCELQNLAQPAFEKILGKPGKARRLANRARDLIKEEPMSNVLTDYATSDIDDPAYVRSTVERFIRAYAPEYALPRPFVFDVSKKGDRAMAVQTNIDFEALNASFHLRVPVTHSTIRTGDLLNYVGNVRVNIATAAAFDADFATEHTNALVMQDRVASAMAAKRRQEVVRQFTDLTLDGLPSVADVINSGQRSLRDLLPLLERAKRFREWIADKSPDADLVKAYHAEVIKDSWIDKLPAKPLRWAFFTVAGLGLHALGLGAMGTVAGIALSAADAFMLDMVARGWKPNQFVERDLIPFVKPPR
jgi:hypothetical protein